MRNLKKCCKHVLKHEMLLDPVQLLRTHAFLLFTQNTTKIMRVYRIELIFLIMLGKISFLYLCMAFSIASTSFFSCETMKIQESITLQLKS